MHDSQVFETLLDHSAGEDGEKRAVYADSAYRSQAHEEKLAEENLESQVCEKGTRSYNYKLCMKGKGGGVFLMVFEIINSY